MPRLLAPVIAADPTPRWKRDRVVRYEPVVPFILPARDMRVLYALSNKHDEGFMTYPLPHAHAYFARMDALMARESERDPPLQARLVRATTAANFITEAA